MGQVQSADDQRLARVKTHLKTVKLVCPRDVAHHADVYHQFTEADYPKDHERFVDLSTSEYMSAIQDQKNYGACTSFATSYMVEYDMRKQGQKPKDLSRLFLYYNSRKLQATENEDSGASLRVVIYAANHDGFCESEYWPYEDKKVFLKPIQHCYDLAGCCKSLSYRRIMPDLNHMRTALNKGFMFTIGIAVYESFMGDKVALTGIIPIPNTKKEQLAGWHALVVTGYDDDKKLFKFANSWSESWGMQGFGFLPYDYVTNDNFALTFDFWTITTISSGTEPVKGAEGPDLTGFIDDSGSSAAAAAVSTSVDIPTASSNE